MNKQNQIFLDEKKRQIKRSLKQKCQICYLSFGILKKQHICKRCLRSVCSDDSPYKKKQFQLFTDGKDHRLCKFCQDQEKKIDEYVSQHEVQFGSDSLLIKKILNSLGKKHLNKQKVVNDFTVKRQFVNLQNLMKSLNPSFRLFVGKAIMKSGKKLAQITDLINWALSQILTVRTGPISQIVYVLLFFFAHSTMQVAIFFTIQTLKIISDIQQFSEQQLIRQFCQTFEQRKQHKILGQFLCNNIKKIASTLTLNSFHVLASSQILIQTINQKNKYPFLISLGLLVKQNAKSYNTTTSQGKQLDIQMQRISFLIAKSKGFRFDYTIFKLNDKQSSNSVLQQYEKLRHQYTQMQSKLKILQRQNKQLKITLKSKQQQINFSLKQISLSKNSSLNLNEQLQKKDYSVSFQNSSCKCQSEKNYYQYKQKPIQQVDSTILQLLKQKNDQIRRLNDLLDQIKDKQNSSTSKNTFQISIRKIQQIAQNGQNSNLKQQNEQLRRINASLLLKLSIMTTKIMDDQEQQIKKANFWFEDPNNKSIDDEQTSQIVTFPEGKQKSGRKTSTSSLNNTFPLVHPKTKKWGILKYLD